MKINIQILAIHTLLLLTLPITRTALAIPLYSRQFGVNCSCCHSFAPRLNRIGLAFQANHYNAGMFKKLSAEKYLPISVQATYTYSHDITTKDRSANFRDFELFLSSGFGSASAKDRGGYFVHGLAATTAETRAGNLEYAFVALPLGGKRSELTLTVGQASLLSYQFDAINSLTESLASTLTNGVADINLTDSVPLLRLDYFNNRSKGTADGTYLSIGVPFRGHLELTRNAAIGPNQGVFAHGFVRRGYSTAGILGYVYGSSNTLSLIATYSALDRWFFTGTAGLAHGPGLNNSYLSAEAEYHVSRRMALTGRSELQSGEVSDLAFLAAINYYPIASQMLRLRAEMVQKRGERAITLAVHVLF